MEDDLKGKKYEFRDFFDLDEIQRLQDLFSESTGVASIITTPEGVPITKASGFSDFCLEVRKTKVGLENCMYSDSVIGSPNVDGPRIQRCKSGGLYDGGASIMAGDQHIANWLIGQIIEDDAKRPELIEYAEKIGVSNLNINAMLDSITKMSLDQFTKVCNFMVFNAQLLSKLALDNLLKREEIDARKEVENRLRREKEQFKVTISSIGEGVITTDKQGNIAYMNRIAGEITGFNCDEAMGKPLSDIAKIVNERTKKEQNRVFGDVFHSGKTVNLSSSSILISRDGTEKSIISSVAPIKTNEGEVNGIVFVLRDNSEEYKYQKALIESERRLIAAQSMAQVGNWELDLDSKMIWASEEALRIYEIEYITPLIAYERVHNCVLPEYLELTEKTLRDLRTGAGKYDLQFKIKTERTGKIKVVHSRAKVETDEAGRAIRISGVVQDITEQKKLEDQLKYMSYHDQLTGLYNRRYFEKRLSEMEMKQNLPISIVMCDLNGLKIINDSFGHAAGDEFLKKAAETIKSGCREQDICVRFGGDEFAIILPNTSLADSGKIVNNIKEIAANVKISGIDLSISFGFDTMEKSDESIFEIITSAENHMYQHKINERTSMHNKTINIIMNTLFEKSSRESAHSMRVSKICEAIAKQMNFDEDDVNQIRVAGLVHDIGKIGVPESILNKEGNLNREEWNEIKNHPESGWRILSASNGFAETAEYILAHHERWDGKGYPKQLKGEAIPVQARIITLADSYDAMTSDRSYKKALSKEEAINVIKKCAGTQFDPKIADVFVEQVLTQTNDFR